MILYFSGTGNSKYVAEHLASLLDDECQRIDSTAITSDNKSSIGIVFPVYAWGLPAIVETFINNNKDLFCKANYIYAVMTCGDDMGYTDTILNDLLQDNLSAAFSVQMPNTYVCLPGFDVDKDKVANEKVESTLLQLPDIAESIRKEEKKTKVVRGAMPWIKSYVLRPLFNHFLVTDKYFKTTSTCNSCKRCVRQCPLHNIAVSSEGTILWKHESCTGCLRCYHQCPNKAILFGAFTKGKGQKKPI